MKDTELIENMESIENMEPIENMESIEDTTLKMVRTGTTETNFKILKSTNNDGTNLNKLIEEFKLTKAPINARVNKLEEVRLVRRWRGTGLVMATDLGKELIEMINNSIISHKIEDAVRNAARNAGYDIVTK